MSAPRKRVEYDPSVLTHVDAEAARRRSVEVVEWARTHFSEKKYAAAGRRLTVRWLPSWTFDAYAGGDAGDPAHDLISISSGVPIALHDDAETFLKWVAKEIGRSFYDEVYKNVGLPRMRGLPPGLDHANAVDRMFRLTMAWLYLHEQAHLFQRHGNLMLDSSQAIEEFASDDTIVLTGRTAAVRHACELSADHEAAVLTLQLMMLADEEQIQPGTLWLFFAGLTCMFQRFYGVGERPIAHEAVGSHPPPSYRMWLTQKLVLSYLMHPKVAPRVRELEGIRHIQAVLDHANVTAAMYWNARYRTGQPVDDFLSGAGGLKPVDKAYQKLIFDTWTALRPEVAAGHFGWGVDAILDLQDPAVLGARPELPDSEEASRS
jgi:hypothetical protein